jgi:ethanolamine utilization protein EutN
LLLGTVQGSLWATKKAAGLAGQTFLTVRLSGSDRVLVCADCVGAGEGERVLVATGAAARTAAGRDIPVDAAVVGIVDAGQTGRT